MAEKKKVFQINSTYGLGSTGRIVEGLSKVLSENGYECMAAYGRGQALKEKGLYFVGSSTGVYIHGGLSRITDNHGGYSKMATKRLITKMKKFDPDIIHLHNLHGYYLNLKLLFEYLKTCEKKIIWTLHDCFAFTGHCTHFEYIGCQKWQKKCHHCEQKGEYPKSILGDRSKKNYKEKKKWFTKIPNLTIVTPSFWLSQKVKQSFLQEYPVVVIPNGIDLDVFRPAPKEKKDKFVILGVANPWRERKGYGEYKKLIGIISDYYEVTMVGLKESQLRELPRGVRTIGKTDQIEELVSYYSNADILVDLTFEDTFPTTHLESLACGTPVLTYTSGGSKEMLVETCGIAVPRGNLQGVMAALEKVRRENPFTREACRKKALAYDQTERFYEYVWKVYQEMRS